MRVMPGVGRSGVFVCVCVCVCGVADRLVGKRKEECP